jgi:hypothetical protein
MGHSRTWDTDVCLFACLFCSAGDGTQDLAHARELSATE